MTIATRCKRFVVDRIRATTRPATISSAKAVGLASNPFWVDSPPVGLASEFDVACGINSSDARERLARSGPNSIAIDQRPSLVRKLFKRLVEPLTAILLAAAAVSGASGDGWSLSVMVLIIVFSIGLDPFQKRQAEKTVDALRQSVAVLARVVRDGTETTGPVDELVPGDLVKLRAGDLVPADGLVLTGALRKEV